MGGGGDGDGGSIHFLTSLAISALSRKFKFKAIGMVSKILAHTEYLKFVVTEWHLVKRYLLPHLLEELLQILPKGYHSELYRDFC